MLLAAPWVIAQAPFDITYNYTGAGQTYTVPAGIRAVQIQVFGAGGGGGGSDDASGGGGGAGGRGSGISAIYSVVPGTVLNLTVGGGGAGAAGPGDCNTSGGAGGLAGGPGGHAGGMGGIRSCATYSGAGGGGGAASVVATQAGAALLTGGGGGGGQGGALNLPGRDGLGTYVAGGTPSYIGPVFNFSGPRPADSTFCTAESIFSCNFFGTREVWYGTGSSWKVAAASNGAPCNSSVFGDPAPGFTKSCYYRPYTGSWTPPPGTTGGSVGSGDGGRGGGGGGGGGGCVDGAGGAANPDGGLSPNSTAQGSGGASCVTNALPRDVPGSTVSAAGGLGGAGGTSTASPGQPGAAGSVVITYPKLTLAKSQPSPGLTVGINSVYTLTVTNTNTTGVRAYTARVVDQLPPQMTYVGSSGTGWSCSPAANAGGTLVTCDFSGTIEANGGTAVLQITAVPTYQSTVTNYAAVDPIGSTSPPVATTCTADNAPLGCAAPVVTPVRVAVNGYGYGDLNHNGTRDAGEIGRSFAGSALYVKITTRTGGVCNFPALAVATINESPDSGAYSFPNVAPGGYCLLLQLDSSLTSNNPGYPPTYIGTENPTGVIQFTVGIGAVPLQNFGLYSGSWLAGTVFADNGAGGGIANNGLRDGTEAGLAGITVILTRGGTELDRAVSAADGSFTLNQGALSAGPATITPVLPGGYTATGGTPGTLPAGSYTRPGVNYTTSSGRTDTGVTFGMVAPNTLAPNSVQTAEPGGVVIHAHTYTAATGGQVTFTLANAASPASPDWSQVLYQDSNCNTVLEAGEPQVTAPIPVIAGQKICLIVKQYVPAGAGLNAQNAVTLSAAFSYTNAAPALGISTLVATDLTTVSQAGDLELSKRVSNVTQAIAAATSVPARPGDTLQYALTATNTGTKPLSTLVVSDVTPAFTNFVSAACPGVLPAGMTGCALTTQPAVAAKGAVQWTLTGSLGPGAQVTVTYNVKLDQ